MKFENIEIANGMQFRSKGYGVFKKDKIYTVMEHNEFNIKFYDEHYLCNQMELNKYFEIVSLRSTSDELTTSILECFENLLDKHGILIPDEDRTGDNGEACLYGMTYYDLHSQIAEILSAYVD